MEITHSERVAGAVRAEMARRRVTQGQLAAHLGLSQVAVSRRVLGQTPFDVDELFAAAEFLNVPVTVLLATEVAA